MPERESRVLAGRRILLAEDEMAVAMSMTMLLEATGCEVDKVARYRQGLAHLETEKMPDAAVLDITLADGPVYPLAEALTEYRVPFVFLSGYNMTHVPARWRNQPSLEKPMNPDALIAWLTDTLKRP